MSLQALANVAEFTDDSAGHISTKQKRTLGLEDTHFHNPSNQLNITMSAPF